MGELSDALSVPLSTATRMVDWLVKNGYAQRLPDPEDRRIVRVTLTSNGRKIYKAIESYIEQRFEQILSCLTVEEQGTLYTLLSRVMSALK
jgi:DNA-binding MarR family transcriptional regulator